MNNTGQYFIISNPIQLPKTTQKYQHCFDQQCVLFRKGIFRIIVNYIFFNIVFYQNLHYDENWTSLLKYLLVFCIDVLYTILLHVDLTYNVPCPKMMKKKYAESIRYGYGI